MVQISAMARIITRISIYINFKSKIINSNSEKIYHLKYYYSIKVGFLRDQFHDCNFIICIVYRQTLFKNYLIVIFQLHLRYYFYIFIRKNNG